MNEDRKSMRKIQFMRNTTEESMEEERKRKENKQLFQKKQDKERKREVNRHGKIRWEEIKRE